MSLSTRDFSIGMRVEYVSGKYGTAENNPLKGSKYYCTGTVTEKIDGTIYVAWDNGTSNDYCPSALAIVKNDNPNYLFKIRKTTRR